MTIDLNYLPLIHFWVKWIWSRVRTLFNKKKQLKDERNMMIEKSASLGSIIRINDDMMKLLVEVTGMNEWTNKIKQTNKSK